MNALSWIVRVFARLLAGGVAFTIMEGSIPDASAFPEMVRHGYVNCTSCHVSPTGGGTLSRYGRELSREVLSLAGSEKESRYAYFVDTPEWLNPGGDFRAVEIYRNNPNFYDARFILMQLDLEAAATVQQFTMDASFGYSAFAPGQSFGDGLVSRRHYLLYQATDTISLRVGRYFYAYGLNLPDHVVNVRRGLQIGDDGGESYNVEAAYLGETLNLQLTGILGRPDSPSIGKETGFAATAAYGFSGSYKAGVSYLAGSTAAANRNVVGPWGILGFSKNIFLLGELDLQFLSPRASTPASQIGFLDYMKLDYEFVQGFHMYLSQQLSRQDFNDPTQIFKSYGIGAQFFPRPHFEINAAWEIQSNANAPGANDYASLMIHFYP